MDVAAAGEALKKLSIEEILAPLLLQLAIIIPFARFCALVGRRFGQPFAVGEIIAGLLLGPSCRPHPTPKWSAVPKSTNAVRWALLQLHRRSHCRRSIDQL